MPLCNQGRVCNVRALVWGAGIPRGVSEPGWNLLYSDKGCRKFNGAVFYLTLKPARGLDNTFSAFICFSVQANHDDDDGNESVTKQKV